MFELLGDLASTFIICMGINWAFSVLFGIGLSLMNIAAIFVLLTIFVFVHFRIEEVKTSLEVFQQELQKQLEEEEENISKKKEEIRAEKKDIEKKKNELEEREAEIEEKDKELEREKEEFYRIKEESREKTKMISEIFETPGERKSEIAKHNKIFIKDLFRIWIRFQKINAPIGMCPEPLSFAKFTDFPENWELREDFDFSSLKVIKLSEKTSKGVGPGDSLILEYRTKNDDLWIELLFECVEDKKYSRDRGWTKTVSRYSLFQERFPIEEVKMAEFHDTLKEIVKNWYDSNLENNRDVMIDYVKSNYEKV